MTMTDDLLDFGNGSAITLNTGSAGNYLIGSQINMNVARDIANGQPLYLVIMVSTGITVASLTGTIAFRLASDGSESVSTTITSSTQHIVTPEWATSTTAIAVGTVLYCGALPAQGKGYEQFLGLLQVTGTTAINAGAVQAFLTTDPAIYTAYANGI